jgi:hypothetical protein
MRHWTLWVALTFVFVLGLAVRAADKPPADYQAAMKDLDALVQTIDKATMADDFDAVTKAADAARKDFEVVEAYWKSRAKDGFEMAERGGKLAFDLSAVSAVKSREGVEFAAKQLKDACAECHAAKRETMPDGTFQIK